MQPRDEVRIGKARFVFYETLDDLPGVPGEPATLSDAPVDGMAVTERLKHALTQAAFAARLGISASYLNLIEHNRRPLNATLLLKLAHEVGGPTRR